MGTTIKNKINNIRTTALKCCLRSQSQNKPGKAKKEIENNFVKAYLKYSVYRVSFNHKNSYRYRYYVYLENFREYGENIRCPVANDLGKKQGKCRYLYARWMHNTLFSEQDDNGHN